LTKIDGARPESQSPAVHEGEEIYCLVRWNMRANFS
jgi:hypothetical protein